VRWPQRQHHGRGERQAPEQVAHQLTPAVAKPRPSVLSVAVGERVAAPHRPRPPLAKAQNLCVMGCHRLVDLDDRVTGKCQANPKVGLFASDRVQIETSDFTEG
jgi:hypothetical protein